MWTVLYTIMKSEVIEKKKVPPFCRKKYVLAERSPHPPPPHLRHGCQNNYITTSHQHNPSPLQCLSTKHYNQGVTKRCRLSLLTNSALVLRV
jgi:hypothetical protein